MKQRRLVILTTLWMLIIPSIIQTSSATPTCGSTITTSLSLTADILGCSSNGLTFGANGITLDCQGHTISGVNMRDSMGIYASGKTGLTITDCTVKSFYYAVYLTNSSFNTLTSNTIVGDANGFELNRGHNNTLVSNNAIGANIYSGKGFKLDYSTNNTFISNIANSWQDGFRIESTDRVPSSPSWNTFRSNNAAHTDTGFTIHTSSSSFIGNIACPVSSIGFYETFGANGVFTGNSVCNAGVYAMILAGSINNTVQSNILTQSTVGIELSGSSNNLIYNNLFANTENVEKESFLGGPDSSYDAWNTTTTLGVNIVGGPYIGGNYWSDYSGSDRNRDGIGDTEPYDAEGRLSTGDALPLCVPAGCGQELKVKFEQDWADYNNDGKVSILDLAYIALVYGGPSDYWDIYRTGGTVISELALVAFYYGQSLSTHYIGQGQPAGKMDPSWKQICKLLQPNYSKYCQTTI